MKNWDIILVLVVSAQALATSYLYLPRWKAFVYSFPFPFTFAFLAVGQQVNVINVLSLFVMFLFMQFVRILYVKCHVPIIAAILCSALCYCLAGWLLVQTVPVREDLFWISAAAVMAFGLVAFRLLPVRDEPGDRTNLKPWVKVPLTVFLVLLLVLGKGELQGVITFFPMVGVFVAYEARRSLWTIGRQNTVVIITVLPMVALIHLLYRHMGIGYVVLAGWAVFLLMFGFMKLLAVRGANKAKKPPSHRGFSLFKA